VAIRVRVPATAAVGQELDYRICVENSSRAAAHHVTVRNPLPANARFVRANPEPAAREPELVWQLGTLEGCACKEITLVLTPIGAGDIKNCARVQFEHGQCVTTKIARPELSLQKVGPAQAVLNDALTYQIVVTNTGSVEARDVLLTDTLPDGLQRLDDKEARNQRTWDLGTLAPGQSRRVEYQVIARKTGRLCNQTAVSAAGGIRQETSHCVTVTEPRLELTIKGPMTYSLNRPATYQITVSNPGSAPLTEVVVTNPLPAQTTFVRASNGGRFADNQVQWIIGTLPAGTRRTVQVELRAQAGGEARNFEVRNRAVATAARDLIAQAETRTLFEGATGLTFDIDKKDDPVEVGKETSYTITVFNQGAAQATMVRIIATVPDQMAVKGTGGPGATRKGQTITFDSINLRPGGTATYEVFVTPQQPGDVRFKVEMTAAELLGGPVRKEESTTIYTDRPTAPGMPPDGW
jgi:uncharacterized repeat protein (TIGR01451 family)